MDIVRLNLFTNCKPKAFDLLKRAYESFLDTFEKIPLTIYCDPKPDIEHFQEYKQNIKNYFKTDLIETTTLSDGYIKSLEAKEDYLFQLQHDFVFQNINHSLKEILSVMDKTNNLYLGFNSHQNKIMEYYYSFMREKEYNGLKYIEMDNISDRPHIINRKLYKEKCLPKIKLTGRLEEIEVSLTKNEITGIQYGGIDYPPTIIHTQPTSKK